MGLRAVGTRVLLLPLPLPFKAKNEHQRCGRVVAVGEESFCDLECGQEVYYHDGEAVAFEEEGETVIVISDEAVLAVRGDFDDEEDDDFDDDDDEFDPYA